MFLEPGDVLQITKSICDYCKDLNDSYIKYKNHSKYLNSIALKIEKAYEISGNNNNKNTPEVILKFYNYSLKFKKEVENLKRKNLMKRLWYLITNNDRLEMFKDELDYIMKEFSVENYKVTDNSYNLLKTLEKEMIILRRNHEIFREKFHEKENEKINNYINDNLSDDQLIVQGMLTEVIVENGGNKSSKYINEFKEDEEGCTIQTMNMIEESKYYYPEINKHGRKMLGYMHRISKVSQRTTLSSIPSWFINEAHVEIHEDNINSYLGYIYL